MNIFKSQKLLSQLLGGQKTPLVSLRKYFCQKTTPTETEESEEGLAELRQKFSDILKTVKSSTEPLDEFSLTPHQRWLLHNRNMERPYNGECVDQTQPGTYSCVGCGSVLFRSEHKYQNDSGYASFWADEYLAVREGDLFPAEKLNKENLLNNDFIDSPVESYELCCAKCDGFIGVSTKDGPPPSFTRYIVNSGCVEFSELPWFENPLDAKSRRQEISREMREREKVSFENRQKFDEQKYYDVVDIVDRE